MRVLIVVCNVAVAGAPGAPSPNLAAAGGAGGSAAKGSEDYASWGQYYSTAPMTGHYY